jgi:hypothetical protein
VNLLQRMHRFWQSRPDPDHPLREEEEQETVPPVTLTEEVASFEERSVAAELDPDENNRPRL